MTLECRDQKATQQSRTYLGISQGFGWPSEILKEILNFFSDFSPIISLLPLFPHYSCWKETLVILYFLCYLKHKNFLWQNYGHILEQVVVLRALWNLYVATESQRWPGRARGLTPRTPFCFFWNLHVLPWDFWVKSGKEETAFSNFRFDFHLSSGLGLEKKKKKIWGGKKKKKRKSIPRKTMKN